MKEGSENNYQNKKKVQPGKKFPAASNFLNGAAKEIKVTFSLDRDLLNKTKAMANMQNTLPKDEINQAILERIKNYEETRGPIEQLPEEEAF